MGIARVSLATGMARKARLGLLLLVAGCTADKGAHFFLTGDARKDWKAASAQGCGNEFAAADLRKANEEHLKRDIPGILFYDSSTPKGVDHRYWLFRWGNTEVFFPPEICPKPDAGAPEPKKEPEIVIDLDADAGAEVPRPTPAMPVAKPRSTSTAKPTATGAPEVPTL